MRNAGGCRTTEWLDGRVTNVDTFTCAHGNEIVEVPPGADPASLGGFCRMCMKPICPKCAAIGTCIPFEKKLEAFERRDRLRAAAAG